MKGKTVVITGASTGIGKAIARLFIEKESNVVMNSSSEERLRTTYEEFGSPHSTIIMAGDISQKR